jgi:6-phosphogluconolactonase
MKVMRGFALVVVFICLCVSTQGQVRKELLYAGTFSVRGSQVIYVLTFDRAKRTLKVMQSVPSLTSPSFLTIHPSGNFLYSVNRGKAEAADNGGSVSAYGLDPKTGRLSGLNNRSSYGDEPCHIAVDKSGDYIFVSNYNRGNLVVLPLFDDGLIGGPSDAKKYVGSSVNTERQEGPHVHASVLSPDNKFLYVTDLGTDKIYIYAFDASNGTLRSTEPSEIKLSPGTGPRHFTFHPNGKFAYVSEELTSSVAVFAVNPSTGALTVLQDTVSTLPETFKGSNTTADIHTDLRGKYLYVSNRGHNSISIFSIAANGMIQLIGQEPTGGKTPRNFLMDPRGEFMFVANQDSDMITMFRVVSKTGKLLAVGRPLKVPSPVCLKYLSLK